jgi:uncharacterized phage protein (TIGR01671 family)
MREILFRGKSKGNGKWVEGNLLTDKGGNTFIALILEPERNSILEPVIPETVGQYTGLKDKEGNRIFEGDVVNCHFEIDGCDTRDDSLCCVVFVAGYWGLDNGVDRFPNALYDIGFELLIIGNIHDNPELLEEEL